MKRWIAHLLRRTANRLDPVPPAPWLSPWVATANTGVQAKGIGAALTMLGPDDPQ
jgi:hypothetical protein